MKQHVLRKMMPEVKARMQSGELFFARELWSPVNQAMGLDPADRTTRAFGLTHSLVRRAQNAGCLEVVGEDRGVKQFKWVGEPCHAS